jgi:uncharacterized membrane protein YdfJ with MMPL/SSD domain
VERQRATGVIVLVASMLAVLGATYSGYRSASYAHCQARVNQALVVSQNARAQAAAQDRAALDRMVNDVVNAHSREESRAALDRYQATRRASDEERAKHPLPAPPSQVCG